MEIILSKALPMNIVKHIKSYIPKDRDMKSPVADLLAVNKYKGRNRTGPSKHDAYNKYSSYYRYRLLSSNNFWRAREEILHIIHLRDLYNNKHCDNYMTALSRYDIGEIISGSNRYDHVLFTTRRKRITAN